MTILNYTYLLNGLLMILFPVALGVFLKQKFHLPTSLWGIGAATIILSQVGHIPFNWLLTISFQKGWLPSPPQSYALAFNAIVLGLSAGLWEESFRYLVYRWWAKEARSWKQALMLGAGHGGIEAILVGVLVLATHAGMMFARDANLVELVPEAQVGLLQAQLQAYWSAPWYATFLGALERLFAMAFHLSAAVMVLQVFQRRQIRWLWMAIAWHTVINAVAVFTVATWGPFVTEAILGVSSIVSLGIVFSLRQPDPPVIETTLPGQNIPPQSITISELPITLEDIDQTRFQK